MTSQEQQALMAITLHAAFADGSKDAREREQGKQMQGQYRAQIEQKAQTIDVGQILEMVKRR